MIYLLAEKAEFYNNQPYQDATKLEDRLNQRQDPCHVHYLPIFIGHVHYLPINDLKKPSPISSCCKDRALAYKQYERSTVNNRRWTSSTTQYQ